MATNIRKWGVAISTDRAAEKPAEITLLEVEASQRGEDRSRSTAGTEVHVQVGQHAHVTSSRCPG
jgi:hypothetical protein